MPNNQCGCCAEAKTQNGGDEPPVTHWTGGSPPLEAELPPDVQSALGRFLGTETVDTLADWARELRRQTDGGSITTEELCLTDDATDHWGTVDGERHQFECFYDAVILAALADRPVDIRTKSPTGDVIEARALGSDDLTVKPESAVFSFGIEEGVNAEAGPSLERGYSVICPYVKAFPDAAAYHGWADRVPAATVALPLDGATELAAALVNGPSH